jgi:hypothetical protein
MITPEAKELIRQIDNMNMALGQLKKELAGHYADERKKKGLKPNRIDAETLSKVIKHYFNNGQGMVSKSFQAIYDANTDPDKADNGMEHDWVKRISNRGYSLEVLQHALDLLKNFAPLKPLFTSKVFNTRQLLTVTSLTAGVKLMDAIVEQELRIMELEAEVAQLKAAQLKKDWKQVAVLLLGQGKTHAAVAKEVGKSTKSIQRLAAA